MSGKVLKVLTFGLGGMVMNKMGMFDEPKTPSIPTVDEAAPRAAAQAELDKIKKRRAAGTTNATGPTGLSSQPTVGRKTLLSGDQ